MAFLGELVVKIAADTAEFVNGMRKANDTMEQTADKFISVGGAMTTAVTLPILGIGAALVKTASDAEETASKFNTVFRDIKDSANDIADSLSTDFGLSSDASKKLLSDTGDLLTGFGFTQQQALDLANEVNQLAVDLASFTNFAGGAEGASVALTKALLGESEQAKALGIVIRQDSDEYITLVKEGMELEGLTLLQAKAMAALVIATNQSQNAIGDYARTSESTANQMKLLGQDLNDLSVSFGERLLPAANELIQVGSDLIEWLTNLDDGTKDAIIRVASLAATIGPLILGVGLAIKAFAALKVALASTLGPIGLVTAAFLTLAAIQGDFQQNFIAKALDAAVAAGRDLNVEIDKIVVASGKTREEVLEIGKGNEIIRDLIIEQEEAQKDINERGLTALRIIAKEVEIRAVLLKSMGFLSPLVEAIIEKYKDIEVVIDEVTQANDDLTESTIRYKERFRETIVEVDEGLTDWKQNEEALTKVIEEETEERTEFVKVALDKQKDEYDVFFDFVSSGVAGVTATINRNLNERADDYVTFAETIEDRTKTLYDNLEKWSGAYFDILGDAIVQGKLDWESLKEAFKDTFVALLKMMSRELFFLAMKNLFSILPGSRSRAAGLFAAAAGARLAAGIIAALAEGALVEPTQDGTLARIGEGRVPEAVLPLTDDVMGRLANRITANMQPQSNIFSPTNNINLPQQMILEIGGEQFNASITDRIRNGQIPIPPRGISQR